MPNKSHQLSIKLAWARKFLRSDAFVVLTGSALTQLIGLGALMVIGRCYSPADFGVFASFFAVSNIFVAIAGFRLHLAVPIPIDDLEAAHVCVAALLGVTLISLTSALAVALVPNSFVVLTPLSSIGPLVWALPLAVLGPAGFVIAQYWEIRQRRFGRVALLQVVQATAIAALQFAFGVASAGVPGLIISQVLGCLGVFAWLLLTEFKRHPAIWRRISWRGTATAMYRFRKFPKYSTLEALANTSGTQVPMLILASHNGDAVVGAIAMAVRMVLVPAAMVSTALSQALYPEIVAQSRSQQLGQFIRGRMMRVGLIATLPVIAITVFAPSFTAFAIGPQWCDAARATLWLAPVAILMLIASPLSPALHILEVQRAALLTQVVGLMLRVGLVTWLAAFPIESYSIGYLLYYVVYSVAILSFVRCVSKGRSTNHKCASVMRESIE